MLFRGGNDQTTPQGPVGELVVVTMSVMVQQAADFILL